MSEPMIQLTGPNGAFYVRPELVAAIGPAFPWVGTKQSAARRIYVVSNHEGELLMWDEPNNTGAFL